jgi:azurin
MRMLTILPLLALLACGSEPAAPEPAPKKEAPAPKPEPKPEPKKEEPVDVVKVEGDVAMVALEASDKMMYNTKMIKVPAGKKVKLTLTHTGKMPAASMGHNFVLLQKGTDGQDFAMKSATATDNGYISKDLADKVIAHTKILGGGESATIEFDAPEAGEYVFLCSFPGHYAIMNGKFIVE